MNKKRKETGSIKGYICHANEPYHPITLTIQIICFLLAFIGIPQ